MPQAPKSLLQAAGAPLHPSPLDKSVLLIVDAQEEYVSGGLPLTGVAAALAEIAKVLALARANGVPVFHIVHHGRAGGALFDPERRFAAIVPQLTPREGEAVVVKTLPNAFAGTTLQAQIDATGRRELIITGFMTHMCISATARAALDLGYRNTVVASTLATRDLPDPLGGVATAEAVQRATLAALADRFSIVVPDVAALTAPVAA